MLDGTCERTQCTPCVWLLEHGMPFLQPIDLAVPGQSKAGHKEAKPISTKPDTKGKVFGVFSAGHVFVSMLVLSIPGGSPGELELPDHSAPAIMNVIKQGILCSPTAGMRTRSRKRSAQVSHQTESD
jgi:hypothetical protein